MVRNTYHNPDLIGAANREQISSADLIDGTTMDSSRYVPIFEQQGNKKTAYGAGIGPDDRDRGEGWSDLDLKDNSTTPVDINGKLRWEVYDDPEQENLIAYSRTFRSSDLRAAVSESRTEKVNVPAQAPLAGDDSYLVLGMKVDSGNDGDVLSAANSDNGVGMAYSRYK